MTSAQPLLTFAMKWPLHGTTAGNKNEKHEEEKAVRETPV